jgi:hypothetical protein
MFLVLKNKKIMATFQLSSESPNISRLTEARLKATGWLARKLIGRSVSIEPRVGVSVDYVADAPQAGVITTPTKVNVLPPLQTSPQTLLQEQARRTELRSAVALKGENPYLRAAAQDIASIAVSPDNKTPLADAAQFAADPLNAPIAGVPVETTPMYDELEKKIIEENRQNIHLVK